jgi:hypothetical protein
MKGSLDFREDLIIRQLIVPWRQTCLGCNHVPWILTPGCYTPDTSQQVHNDDSLFSQRQKHRKKFHWTFCPYQYRGNASMRSFQCLRQLFSHASWPLLSFGVDETTWQVNGTSILSVQSPGIRQVTSSPHPSPLVPSPHHLFSLPLFRFLGENSRDLEEV